eukprot:714090_1
MGTPMPVRAPITFGPPKLPISSNRTNPPQNSELSTSLKDSDKSDEIFTIPTGVANSNSSISNESSSQPSLKSPDTLVLQGISYRKGPLDNLASPIHTNVISDSSVSNEIILSPQLSLKTPEMLVLQGISTRSSTVDSLSYPVHPNASQNSMILNELSVQSAAQLSQAPMPHLEDNTDPPPLITTSQFAQFVHSVNEQKPKKLRKHRKQQKLKYPPDGKTPDDRPHECSLCSKRFRHRTSLLRHIVSHSGRKPYTCGICSTGFTQHGSLKQHLLIHSGSLPFKCPLCAKGHRSRSQRTAHMRVHSTVVPMHPCSLCKREFRSRGNLNCHMTIHTGEKRFVCHLCGLRLSRSGGLKEHLRLHERKRIQHNQCVKLDSQRAMAVKPENEKLTTLKRFVCQVCDKKFQYSRQLADHERVHTGERPFKCTVCGTRFARKNYLRKHLRRRPAIHTNEKYVVKRKNEGSTGAVKNENELIDGVIGNSGVTVSNGAMDGGVSNTIDDVRGGSDCAVSSGSVGHPGGDYSWTESALSSIVKAE